MPAHPILVAAYLIDAADTYTEDGERAYAPAALSRGVAAIGHHHRRQRGPTAPPEGPLLVDVLLTIVTAARRTVTGWASEVLERRDSALLLPGFAGASAAATWPAETYPCTGSTDYTSGCGAASLLLNSRWLTHTAVAQGAGRPVADGDCAAMLILDDFTNGYSFICDIALDADARNTFT